jgi:hypothetical protein
MADSMTVKSIKGQINVYKRNLKNTGPNTIGRRNAEKQIKRLQTRLKRLQKNQPKVNKPKKVTSGSSAGKTKSVRQNLAKAKKLGMSPRQYSNFLKTGKKPRVKKVVETEAIFDEKPTSAQRARKTIDEKARQIKEITTKVPRGTQSKAAALAAISFLPPALLTGKFAPLVASVKALGFGEKLTQNLQNRINKVVKEFKGEPPKTTTKIPPTKASPPKADKPPPPKVNKPKKPIGPSVRGIKPPKVTTKRPPPRVPSGTGTRVTAPLPKVKPPAKSKVPTRLKKAIKTTNRALKRNAPAIKTAAAAVGTLSPKPVKAKDPIYRNVVNKKPDPVRPDEDLPMSEKGKTITTGKKRKSLFDAMLGDPMKTGDWSAKDQIVKNPFTGEDMELKYEYPDDPDDGMKKGGSIKKNMKKKKAKTKVKKRAALRGYGKALRGF